MIKLSALLALLLAVGMIGIACGGSDNKASSSPTTSAGATSSTSATSGASATQGSPSSGESDYFAKVAGIFSTGQTGSAAANDTLNTSLDAAQTVDEKKSAISIFLGTMVTVFERATSDMADLDPPADAKAAHDQFKQDIETAKEKSSSLNAQLGAISTDDDLNAIVDQFNNEIDPLVTDSNNACTSLQSVANSDGVAVNLDCGN